MMQASKHTGVIVIAMLAAAGLLLIIMNRKRFTSPKYTPPENVPTSQGAINNPGNIRRSLTQYQGEMESPSKGFKSFISLAYGYRAMIQILRNYYNVKGLRTLSSMLALYAPASDGNPVNAYVDYVSSRTGIDKNKDLGKILYSPEIQNIIYHMSMFEQGSTFAVAEDVVNQAYNLA